MKITVRALHRLDEYCKEYNMPIATDEELTNYIGHAIGVINEINRSSAPNDLTSFGFTPDEIKSWFQSEPDFPKRIATPLRHRKRDTRNGHQPDETVYIIVLNRLNYDVDVLNGSKR